MLRPTIAALALAAAPLASALTPMEQLGKAIFFDTRLSQPAGQSCASCHDPATGFTSPSQLVNATGGVVPGAMLVRTGSRKPPAVAYASLAAPLEVVNGPNGLTATGGMFWDGRATGDTVTVEIFPSTWTPEMLAEMSEHLGPAADQAMGPFLNDLEQNLPNARTLCQRIASSNYAAVWQQAWGAAISCGAAEANLQHQRAAFAIAVWERSSEVNSFSSKYDQALNNAIAANGVASLPLADFSPQENLGMELFFDPRVGCARFCHASSVQSRGLELGELFAPVASSYFNLGVPRNPANPYYLMNLLRDDQNRVINPQGRNYVDVGLGGVDLDGVAGADFTNDRGAFKTPTLRNIGKAPSRNFIKAFSHNGYFKSLEQMVHFYNTRDVKPLCVTSSGAPDRLVTAAMAIRRGCWPEAEVTGTNIFDCNAGANCKVPLAAGETFATYCNNPANPRGIGNLCLTANDEAAIVAFLHTLTDRAVISRR